jgi:hypothetical protein
MTIRYIVGEMMSLNYLDLERNDGIHLCLIIQVYVIAASEQIYPIIVQSLVLGPYTEEWTPLSNICKPLV